MAFGTMLASPGPPVGERSPRVAAAFGTGEREKLATAIRLLRQAKDAFRGPKARSLNPPAWSSPADAARAPSRLHHAGLRETGPLPDNVSNMLSSRQPRMYTVAVTAIGAIPLAPRFRLERAQLAQVICQLRFSPVLRIRQDEAVIPFQEAVRAEYPRYARQEGMSVLITPGGVQPQPAQAPLHRFEDSTGALTAILAPDFVALETTAFVDVDDFVGRVVRLAESVAEHYAPAELTRIGLRFINELRLPQDGAKAEMRRAISPALLGAPGVEELDEPLVGAQQAIELTGDDHRMLVRHGFNPLGGTTVDVLQGQSPQLDPRPFYLLDLDVFTEESVAYSVEGIEARLREFNDIVRSFFAWAVHEHYRRATLGQTDLT